MLTFAPEKKVLDLARLEVAKAPISRKCLLVCTMQQASACIFRHERKRCGRQTLASHKQLI